MTFLPGSLVSLRRWQQDDLLSLLRIADNPRIAANMRDVFPHPYIREDGIAWLEIATNEFADFNWAVIVDDEVAGGIGLMPQSDINAGTAEIGYWLGEPFWGRGLATDAVRTLTMYAFTQLGFRRLFATVFARNVPSCRVLEKAGYEREGLLRCSAIKNGVVSDQILFARVSVDCDAPRPI